VSSFIKDYDRAVVPRWRDFLTTLRLGQLESATVNQQRTAITADLFNEKIIEWQRHRAVPFAADLVGTAYALGRRTEATDAAKFLIDRPNEVSPTVLTLARQVVGQTVPLYDRSIRSVKIIRQALADDPRNALLWVELARLQSAAGFSDKAIHAMRVAIGLASTSRYILRSAVRMFVHFDQPDEALWLLRHNPVTALDPWLIAAEVAVASHMNRPPGMLRNGRSMLDSGKFSPFHLTELLSAIATVDLTDGNQRRAKKLFRAALADPTDNTVAQVEWASRRIGGDFEVEPEHLATQYAFEARAWESYSRSEWRLAVSECEGWLLDEPFSRRAAILGSYIASGPLCNYEQAGQIASRGIRANPHDYSLLNNLSFALASAGNLDEARKAYSEIDRSKLDDESVVFWLATGGLLRFREGFSDEGRALYLQAIDKAGSPSTSGRSVAAAIYLAREELLAKTPFALEALERAARFLNSYTGAFPESLRASFQKVVESTPLRSSE
jgi:tetratricopeptide (TPR) repeat protein